MAEKKGIFKKHGLDVTILKMNSAPEVVTYISMKRADIGLYYMPQSFIASQKAPIRMMAPYIDKPLQGILLRSECDNPKTIGGFPCPLFPHFAKALGTSVEKKYLHGDLAFHLHAKTVDAVFGVYKNIEALQLEEQGIATHFISPQDLGVPEFSELVFVIHKEADRATFRPFLSAIKEAIHYAKMYPDEAFSLYAQSNKEKTSKVLRWEKKAWKQTIPLLSDTLQFDMKQVDRFFSWLQKTRILASSATIQTSLIYDEFDPSTQDLPVQALFAPQQLEPLESSHMDHVLNQQAE